MPASVSNDLSAHIRSIPDFPKKGILFRDITTLLGNAEAFRSAIDQIADKYRNAGITRIAGIESRGFMLAAPLSYILGVGFFPVRKKGKLPYKTTAVTYDLEYGTDTLEMHVDAFERGEKILIADDLLATGGTAKAAATLIEQNGGKVEGAAFLIELSELAGRQKLAGYRIDALIRF